MHGEWSNGRLIVQSDPTAVSNYDITLYAEDGKIKYYYGSDDEQMWETGATYSGGGGSSSITWPSTVTPTSPHTSFTVKYKSSSGTTTTKTFSLTVTNGKGYVSMDGNLVANT